VKVRIEHVAVWVRDLERMREFYVRTLGGTSGALYHNDATGYRSYFIALAEGARVELMQMPGVPNRKPGDMIGYAHIALSVGGREAVDAAAARLLARGVTVVSGPRETGDGYYEAVALDPEGNRIELTA
jgi:lactoylglutathione lyase